MVCKTWIFQRMLGLGGMLRVGCSSLFRQSVAPLSITSPSSFSTSNTTQKIKVDPAVLDIPVQYNVEREVWVESLSTKETELTSIMTLHPEVWAVYPRMDVIHQNMVWQQKYNVVNYNHVKNVKEMIYAYGGGAKPWRQKGTGIHKDKTSTCDLQILIQNTNISTNPQVGPDRAAEEHLSGSEEAK